MLRRIWERIASAWRSLVEVLKGGTRNPDGHVPPRPMPPPAPPEDRE